MMELTIILEEKPTHQWDVSEEQRARKVNQAIDHINSRRCAPQCPCADNAISQAINEA